MAFRKSAFCYNRRSLKRQLDSGTLGGLVTVCLHVGGRVRLDRQTETANLKC